ncbi:uncharacterized protein LOC118195107 [Stegodyphus dumicola]|uniref:uncharacterized protein LOC118195107 n=1 Tax=Stegodyphus dumicola TaxID=202533 RepID=UPI0015A99B37|nr:uncharacterized protein LOC118195107 [Stegodyphus dumicola]
MRRLLLSMQRLQLLPICKGYRITSTTALQVLAGIPPLDLQAERESLIARVLRLGEEGVLWEQHHFAEDFEKHKPVTQGHSAETHLKKGILGHYVTPKDNHTAIFTDASKTETGTGSAFCVLKDDTVVYKWKRRLGSRNSVFQAELAALKAAINYVKRNRLLKVLFTVILLLALKQSKVTKAEASMSRNLEKYSSVFCYQKGYASRGFRLTWALKAMRKQTPWQKKRQRRSQEQNCQINYLGLISKGSL